MGVTQIDLFRIIIYCGNSIEKVKVETYPKSVSESQIDICTVERAREVDINRV